MGLFATRDIPELTIFAEYYGDVGTSAMVSRHAEGDTYALRLPIEAQPENCTDAPGLSDPVDTLVADPYECVAARANTLKRRDEDMLRANGTPRRKNALLVNGDDPTLARDLKYSQTVWRSASLLGRPNAKYKHVRLYLLSFDPIKAGDEIFLEYGASHSIP